MESFICNMNTIYSRVGNHAIFSSINYGTDTSAEGRCVIRELLLVTERGIGNNETPIFPVQIWKKKRGVNYLPEDRNYDLFRYACSVSAKRYYPNYINLVLIKMNYGMRVIQKDINMNVQLWDVRQEFLKIDLEKDHQ